MTASEKEKAKITRLTKRTWCGVPVEIEVSSENWHRVTVAGVPLPHPGLVNFISRWEMPVEARLRLTEQHEFAHLQVLLIPLIHLALMLHIGRRESSSQRWPRVLAGLLANHALWEIASESYVAASSPRDYYIPTSRFGRWLYTSFWGLMLFVVIAGTMAATGLIRFHAEEPFAKSR
ncbi:MAG: hypothetical protein P1P76_04520 [Anaerolineales bacterium]|nr:hypothetical protein [Anaerolineales bacterium]